MRSVTRRIVDASISASAGTLGGIILFSSVSRSDLDHWRFANWRLSSADVARRLSLSNLSISISKSIIVYPGPVAFDRSGSPHGNVSGRLRDQPAAPE